MARLDHSFERGLTDVSATYTRREVGFISVSNRGFNATKEKFETANGKAKFFGEESEGHLRVSFLDLSTEFISSLASILVPFKLTPHSSTT